MQFDFHKSRPILADALDFEYAQAQTADRETIAFVLRSSLTKSMRPPSIPMPDTLRGIDDLIRSNLEDFREIWFMWLLIATGLVVVGLLFEAPEIWHETIGAIRELRQSGKPKNEMPAWIKLFGMVGWLLIVLGVGGEFITDTFVSRADGYVQKFDEILLADAQRQAGDAAISARTARQEADAAGKAASKAQGKAELAESSSQQAGRDAHGAQQDAAKVRTDLTEVEVQRHETEEILQIEAQYGAGHPNGPPLRTFKNGIAFAAGLLRQLPPAKVTVECKGPDTEACPFARMVSHVLKNVGWNVATEPRAIGPASRHAEKLPNFGVRFNKHASSPPIPSLDLSAEPYGPVFHELTMNDVNPLMNQGLDPVHGMRLGILSMELEADLVKDGTMDENSFLIVVGAAKPKDK